MPVVLLLALALSAAPGLRERLVGTWRNADFPEQPTVTFQRDGTGRWGDSKVKWRLEGVKLTVTYDDGSQLLARVELVDGELRVTDLVDTDVSRYRRVKR